MASQSETAAPSIWHIYTRALFSFIIKTIIGAEVVQFIWNYALVADFSIPSISFLTVFLIMACLHWWYNGLMSHLKTSTIISSNIYRELFYIKMALGEVFTYQYNANKSSSNAPQAPENEEKSVDNNSNN
jgi:hypothetical protein